MRKQELIFKILQAQTEKSGLIFAEGVLECLPDGFGFLRAPEYNYLPGPDDIYVSPSQIRRFDLRTGDTVSGQMRQPKEGERYFALIKVEAINFEDPDKARHKIFFDNLTPLYPEERLKMEVEEGHVGAGDRPRGADRQGPAGADRGAAAHRQDDAAAEHRPFDHRNHPECYPHRAADRRAARGGHRHAALGQGRGGVSTFDEPATRHVQVAEMVIEKAKRLVEHKPRRGHPARFDHPPGARLQHRAAVLGQGADRRRRRQRAAAAEALLRRRAQHRGGRQPDHHRDRAGRHRQPHGRRDLRGVQGHRQLRAPPRPQAGRQARLPGDRHPEVGHPQGGAAGSSRDTTPTAWPRATIRPPRWRAAWPPAASTPG
jgi:hypothetical protein